MILEVQNGCFGYPKQKEVLKNINLSLRKATFYQFLVQTALERQLF